MKSAIYPITLIKKGEGFLVRIPDFAVEINAESYEDAFYQARIQISLKGIDFLRHRSNLPVPSEIASLKTADGEIATLVDVDFAAFKRIIDSKTVRRNCTLPAWLDDMAGEAGINVSAVLQSALKKELNVDDPMFE